eukprot:SAG31_NODE_17468_length_669_cov_1.612281_1_plen_175_part_00
MRYLERTQTLGPLPCRPARAETHCPDCHSRFAQPPPPPPPPPCAKATPAPWKKQPSAASAPSSFAQLQEKDKQAAAVLERQLELAAEAEAKAELAARERELLQPNPTLVRALTDMGFGANVSARACLATGNGSVDAACGWVLENLGNQGKGCYFLVFCAHYQRNTGLLSRDATH